MTKNKFNKLVISLALLLLTSFALFALPVSAQSPPVDGGVTVVILQESSDSDNSGKPENPDKDPNTGNNLSGGKESSKTVDSGMIEVAGSGNPLVEVPGSKPVGKLPATGSHNLLLISLFSLSGIFFFAYYYIGRKSKASDIL